MLHRNEACSIFLHGHHMVPAKRKVTKKKRAATAAVVGALVAAGAGAGIAAYASSRAHAAATRVKSGEIDGLKQALIEASRQHRSSIERADEELFQLQTQQRRNAQEAQRRASAERLRLEAMARDAEEARAALRMQRNRYNFDMAAIRQEAELRRRVQETDTTALREQIEQQRRRLEGTAPAEMPNALLWRQHILNIQRLRAESGNTPESQARVRALEQAGNRRIENALAAQQQTLGLQNRIDARRAGWDQVTRDRENRRNAGAHVSRVGTREEYQASVNASIAYNNRRAIEAHRDLTVDFIPFGNDPIDSNTSAENCLSLEDLDPNSAVYFKQDVATESGQVLRLYNFESAKQLLQHRNALHPFTRTSITVADVLRVSPERLAALPRTGQ